MRNGDQIVDAPMADRSVAGCYPKWRNKGPSVRGMRLTIMTLKNSYAVGDEVRVIHVLEAQDPGVDVYVMGPKAVYGEEVDGILRTTRPPSEAYPWLGEYDGAVVESPAVDFNYEISSYRFTAPGRHRIQWKLGDLASNVVIVEVE